MRSGSGARPDSVYDLRCGQKFSKIKNATFEKEIPPKLKNFGGILVRVARLELTASWPPESIILESKRKIGKNKKNATNQQKFGPLFSCVFVSCFSIPYRFRTHKPSWLAHVNESFLYSTTQNRGFTNGLFFTLFTQNRKTGKYLKTGDLRMS